MFIAAPVHTQLATEAVRRAIAAGGASINAPGPVAAVSAISPQNEERQGGELLQRLAGRVLPALVLARLDDMHGIVDIAGERYSVAARLPESGQSVLLRFADIAAGNSGAAATAPVSSFAGASPALPQAAAQRNAQVVLGSLAQQLSEVATANARPLVLGPVAASIQAVPAFAAALGALVRDSGMFYESHVARWSRGQYPLTQLQREPQAVSTATGTGAGPAAHPVGDGAARAPIPVAAQATLVATELQPIVREQLDLLEHRGLSVMIDAWPGQAVQLEIRQQVDDNAERRGPTEATAEDALWATRLTLELPRLGRLEAHIGLTGDRLQLVFQAAPATGPLLGAESNHLSEALAQAGVRLTGLRVQP